jgi:hypothetical protein
MNLTDNPIISNNFILGPTMIPDKKIFRRPNEKIDEPHYVVFSAETIAKCRNKFHAKNLDNKVNINHNGILLDGITMTKSFLISDENKNELPEVFKDLPNGTWMVEYHIQNEKVWKLISDKKINGFSVEGMFNYE